MPPITQKYNILLQHPVPGASSLALNALRKPDQTYHDAIAALCQSTNLVHGWDLDRDDIAEGSIAYHPIFGDIIYGYSWWRASTMELCDNLKAAEANPAIAAHLIHIDSCGGQAFGLHETFDLIRSLKKPCYAVVESCAASAAYYLAAGCDKIFTTSKFSKVGSIGVMVVYVDDSEYMEKEGIKVKELYSNYSPLKNQDSRNLENGETKEFIEKYLDPLAKAFIEDVQKSRKGIAEDSDALKGEIFLGEAAQAEGLIDGVSSLDDVIAKLIKKTAAEVSAEAPAFDINQLTF